MKTIYAKFLRDRLPEFQIETSIFENEGMLFSKKRPLVRESINHIKSIYANFQLLRTHYKNINMVSAAIENDTILFDFIKGKSFDEILIDTVINENKLKMFSILDKYISFINGIDETINYEFYSDKRFIKIFGDGLNLNNISCFEIANIDLNFGNLIVDSEENIWIIDYEWVFMFPIPVNFIIYRSINEFFAKFKEIIVDFVNIDDIFKHCGISENEQRIFSIMERNFQIFVYGNTSRVSQKYLKEQIDIKKIIASQNSKIEELSIWGKNLDDEIIKLNVIITNQNARIEELSSWGQNLNNEINQKNGICLAQKKYIKELEQKNQEQIEQIEIKSITINNQQGHIEQLLQQERILNSIYASQGWRLLNLLYKIEEFLIPQNSRRKRYLRKVYKSLKKFREILHFTNFRTIRKFFKKLFSAGIKGAFKDVRIYTNIYRNQPPEKRLEVFDAKGKYEKLVFKEAKNPKVSIIIPVYNQWGYTYSCLKSILANTKEIEFEVIIADDVSNDETVNIKNYVENIKVIRNEKNLGFLQNCNQAAKMASGKYIHFLNNDTNVQNQWLNELVNVIEKNSTIGLIGSKLVYADGRLQEAGGIIWKDASGWNYGRLDDPEKPEYNYVKDVDYISGASIMIRAELWKDIGGFDERYIPAYYEDTDLAFEVRKKGYRVVYQPSSVVLHFEGVSHGNNEALGIKKYQTINREKFINKWSAELQKNHFLNGENVFIARDRCKNKRTILVIDHYVPHFDKDAGSRAVFCYLDLFIKMGLNVKFIGDNFYRHEPYTTVLQQKGIEVLYGNYYNSNWESWIKSNAVYFDYVVLNRPHISIKYIDIIKKYTTSKILYYIHDLHFLREQREYEITGDSKLLKSSQEFKKTELYLMSKSDYVLSLNQIEKTIINQELPNVKVVVLPILFYNKFFCDYKGFHEKKDLLFVGGFNHHPNVDGLHWFVNEIYPIIMDKIPDIKLHVAGSNPTPEILALNSENIIIKGYISDKELLELYQNCRVCVIPLRYGAGMKGKTIEALFYGTSIVSTKTGIEGLEEGNDYILNTDDPVEFARLVCDLYNDEKSIVENQTKYTNYLKKYFSYDRAKKIFESMFSN